MIGAPASLAALAAVGPGSAVAGLAMLVLLADMLWPKRERMLAWLSVAGLVAVFLWTAAVQRSGTFLSGTVRVDGASVVFEQVFLASAALVVLLCLESFAGIRWKAEYLAMLLFVCAGAMFLASANEMLTLYVSLEVVTIAFFVLSSFRKDDPLSVEAGLKLYVQGFASSAVLVYGLSLLYGLSGSTTIPVVARYLAGGAGSAATIASNPVALLAAVMVLAGLAFKLSVVPFHMWVPDVYQGAPTPVTAYLSVASKAAGFIAAARLLLPALSGMRHELAALLGAIALITMTFGNLVAIVQTNLKRMLAYSTIAHAGYLLLGLVMWNSLGMGALMFYLIVYLFANILAFAVVIAISRETGSEELQAYGGLLRRSPLICLGMTAALLSLGGIPPLAGFVGKFYLFASAAGEGYILLAAAGVVNSLISMYYYIRVVREMFWGHGIHREMAVPFGISLVVLICLIALLALGLFPNSLLATVKAAAAGMFPA